MALQQTHKGLRAQDDGWKGSSSAGTGKCQVKAELPKLTKKEFCFAFHIAELWIPLTQDAVGSQNLYRFKTSWTKLRKFSQGLLNVKMQPFL